MPLISSFTTHCPYQWGRIQKYSGSRPLVYLLTNFIQLKKKSPLTQLATTQTDSSTNTSDLVALRIDVADTTNQPFVILSMSLLTKIALPTKKVPNLAIMPDTAILAAAYTTNGHDIFHSCWSHQRHKNALRHWGCWSYDGVDRPPWRCWSWPPTRR